jgi:hypothetical protein
MTRGRADSHGDVTTEGSAADGDGNGNENGNENGDRVDSDGQRSPRAAARERMERAVRAVRIEGYKAALVYGTADAALAAVTASLAVRVVGESLGVPATVPLPGPLGLATASGAISGAALAALAAAFVTLCAETVVRSRRPLVDQFGAANPDIGEQLRTARDAAADGEETLMAARLYEQTLAALKETSSYRLVDVRRVAVTVLLVTGVGVAGVGVAVVDLDVAPLPDATDGATDGGDAPGAGGPRSGPDYSGLENGSDILGEEEDIETGDDPLNASVDYQAGGGEEAGGPPEAYDQSGFEGDVESQQAGFADDPVPEDAELIREYALAVSEEDDS